jgi:pimeloyl-ACP methyl ester carboxylesterase
LLLLAPPGILEDEPFTEETMHRRHLLRAAVAAVAGTAVAPSRAASPQSRPAAPLGRHGHYVRTRDGESLFFKDWGGGDPVVFLAGWGLPSDMWDYQMVPLSEAGLRCLAYDRRGHGRSSQPGGGYEYDTLADDLATVLETLDLRRVTLVGMSMAGGEIVRYLTRHGSTRIARVMFVGTAATPFVARTADNPNGIPPERLESFRKHVLLRDYPKWLEDNRQPFFVPETSTQLQEWIRMLMLGNSMKALIECHRAMTSTDFRAELPKLVVPTLVVHGDRDVSAPLQLTGDPTARMIPGARLKVYEDAPHGLFLTHMERLTADIRRFARPSAA